jgi:hypothetical protein
MSKAVELLLKAYRDEIVWLRARAKECETDKSLIAADYIHPANNLQMIIDGYERINAKDAGNADAIGGPGSP